MTSLSIREFDISIAEPFQEKLSEQWLEEVMNHALAVALPQDEPGQVSLVIVDDDTIRDLNRQYRGLDETTDVLSFSTVHEGHWEGDDDLPVGNEEHPAEDFVFPDEEVPPLGEVVLCYPQALRQAGGQSDGIEREVALLIVHGVLHLVGHDHLDMEDTTLMKAKEQAALEALFPPGVGTS